MFASVLLDRTAPPGEAEVRALLGESHGWYREVLAMAPVTPQWKYYGRNSGWSLKLLEGKRNLAFVSMHEGGFDVGFVLGEKAVTRALDGALRESLKQALRDARPYAEGRGIRVPVRRAEDLDDVRRLLDLKRGH